MSRLRAVLWNISMSKGLGEDFCRSLANKVFVGEPTDRTSAERGGLSAPSDEGSDFGRDTAAEIAIGDQSQEAVSRGVVGSPAHSVLCSAGHCVSWCGEAPADSDRFSTSNTWPDDPWQKKAYSAKREGE